MVKWLDGFDGYLSDRLRLFKGSEYHTPKPSNNPPI